MYLPRLSLCLMNNPSPLTITLLLLLLILTQSTCSQVNVVSIFHHLLSCKLKTFFISTVITLSYCSATCTFQNQSSLEARWLNTEGESGKRYSHPFLLANPPTPPKGFLSIGFPEHQAGYECYEKTQKFTCRQQAQHPRVDFPTIAEELERV